MSKTWQTLNFWAFLAQALEAEALRAQALLYWIAQKRIRILASVTTPLASLTCET